MIIEGVEIGGPNPCRFVAEVSNNHNGSLDRAVNLIDAAKRAGADFVKFQAYTPDELVDLRGDGPAPQPWGSQGWTMRTLYDKARTPLEWMPILFQHARNVGIVPFASVFGLESLVALERAACPAYKIAKLDNKSRPLVEAVMSRNKPTLVSADTIESGLIGGWFPHMLYCPGGYPCLSEAVKLPRFKEGGWSSPGYIGLSSHCLDPVLPIAAVARGAKILEYHFMLDEEPSELESNISLTAKQFAAMVVDVQATEVLLGNY
jgi:sialic acid synthase SpsE